MVHSWHNLDFHSGCNHQFDKFVGIQVGHNLVAAAVVEFDNIAGSAHVVGSKR